MGTRRIPEGSRFAGYSRLLSGSGSAAERAAAVLREAILDGTLPPSSWLRETELARELGMSRTPVREALKRLAAEGLVEITARQAAVVARMTLEDILEVYAVRETLEGLAARLAARHRGPDHLRRLEGLLSRMERSEEPSGLAALNLEFHRVIREAARNRYLERFLAHVEFAVRRFGRTTFEVPGRPQEALDEHRRLVAAIAAGDAGEAERLAVGHMRRARELRIRMLLEP
ncbi:transcriptional regulator, GntR family [Rubrobacter xylanophilus DSM 9941]|uniref:Transcriptional regulator, GntR family n=1 Tax=Rubrobacter xylanophilus (strain DSM 9941 / JCM 11954 / NBRC 16129 / PRD-1) TaxID=266117 RepID=Q1ARD9_RUBXD|nr:GntR family transcriptional regulator [Rubrobacter xylanophilus]ABG06039.1 transcriptional regulator, GntR family [Rubrobacter xylanophilus DSM 9941]